MHCSAARWFTRRQPDWFDCECLPAYAPELNPTEQCWNHTQYADLANFLADAVHDLQAQVEVSLYLQRHPQTLLRPFFPFAKLTP